MTHSSDSFDPYQGASEPPHGYLVIPRDSTGVRDSAGINVEQMLSRSGIAFSVEYLDGYTEPTYIDEDAEYVGKERIIQYVGRRRDRSGR